MLNIKKDTLVLDELPFCIGAQSTPNNPSSIPNRATLLLKYCAESTLISLEPSDELEKLLNSAYEYGFEMGIPSDSTELGGPYVKDFLKFIKANIEEKAEILEIGAGTGYLSKLLMEDGHEVDALEPGKGYAEAWAKHDIPVIQDFFPSSFLKKKYDVIIFYTVLEHIANLNEFFSHLTARMKPNAKVICAVPDCSLEINAGDPSMLLHEHMHYFTPNSLNWLLQKFFKDSYVCSSGVGRLIYGIAGNNGDVSKVFKFSQNVFPDQYLRKVSGKINFAKNRIKSLKKFGSVGIFVLLEHCILSTKLKG